MALNPNIPLSVKTPTLDMAGIDAKRAEIAQANASTELADLKGKQLKIENIGKLLYGIKDQNSYTQRRQFAIQNGIARPEEIPEQYDPATVESWTASLNDAKSQLDMMMKQLQMTNLAGQIQERNEKYLPRDVYGRPVQPPEQGLEPQQTDDFLAQYSEGLDGGTVAQPNIGPQSRMQYEANPNLFPGNGKDVSGAIIEGMPKKKSPLDDILMIDGKPFSKTSGLPLNTKQGSLPSTIQEYEYLKTLDKKGKEDFWRIKRQQEEDAFGTKRGGEAGKTSVTNENAMLAVDSINTGMETAKSIAKDLELSGRLGAPIGNLVGDPVYDRLRSQLARIIPEVRVASAFPAAGFSDADRQMLENSMGNPNMTVGALLQIFDDVITQGNARKARLQQQNQGFAQEFNYGGMQQPQAQPQATPKVIDFNQLGD